MKKKIQKEITYYLVKDEITYIENEMVVLYLVCITDNSSVVCKQT